MIKSAKVWWIGGALAATIVMQLAVVAPASAQQPYSAWGWGSYYWPYSIYTQPQMPYYAQHPPVYYSKPVPRTYGYSPFAYPPGIMTPDAAPEPELSVNPYIPESERPQRPVSTTRPKVAEQVPRTANPFVSEKKSDESTQPTSLKKSASLTVEPVTLVSRRPTAGSRAAAATTMSDLEQVANAWSGLSEEARQAILDVAKFSN